MNSLCSIDRSLRGFLPSHSAPVTMFSNVQVVVRADDHHGRVKVISGGGSGHEPAHAGYVGPNHLTTAVAGEIFASPSVQQILAGILASGGREDSFLVIVNNYTGDRLNFSLARDIATNSLGFGSIEILTVADDIAIEDVQESVGRRGLAGCVLMIKICGAMAEDGKSLQEIHSFCTEISQNRLLTIGFTFRSCLKTGEITSVEIGKGIHGEPGASRDTNLTNFDDIAQHLVEKFLKNLPRELKIVLLVNNLGGTSQHLMNVFQFSLIPRISAHYDIVRIISGTFMTSLDQEGISVTILNISGREEVLEYLARGMESNTQEKSNSVKEFDLSSFDQLLANRKGTNQKFQKDPPLLARIFNNSCADLLAECEILNEMDSELGDGDTGTTISQGVTHLLTRFTNLEDFKFPGEFLSRLSWELSRQMGGSSGALYGIFFQAASTTFSGDSAGESSAQLQDWLEALRRGNEALKSAARAKRGDRTMLDPLLAIEEFFQSSGNPSESSCLQNLLTLVAESAAETRKMIPKAGRAAYTMENSSESSKSFRYPDPGAHAVSIWFRGILKCFQDS